ncbi:unnamed protein product [Zymoseptoria tritici ST99CH_3D1]|uniref:Uncharacterized protein n=1 Tax=Zymoseptoria tritici ST99CH_1E4 TaxID=1276532 RepID=A0A2H1GH54_ZYMTR|nr:unnamed protein product [Zymoseptoria tritici ST99CH_1E4]SMR54263.1 unnamed protein product [Zymoseptoria tritici ST99CH_3D1]
MKVADFLSDMTSLQVCDPNAALALVSARPAKTYDITVTNGSSESSNVDLTRAKDLLSLHSSVKMAHQDGTDHELNEARRAVEKVLSTL